MEASSSQTAMIPAQGEPAEDPPSISMAAGFPPVPAKAGEHEPTTHDGAPSVGLTIAGPPFARPVRVESPQQIPQDIKTALSSVEHGLMELMSLQQQRFDADGPELQYQLRFKTNNVLADLKALRSEVSRIVHQAESHRWRKWLTGGLV